MHADPALNNQPPAQPADATTAVQATPQALRLQRLFRHTLKAGEVNPLLLIVPQYRQGGVK